MTLPASGPIGMGQVRTELDASGQINLAQTSVRTLAGVASGQIAMSNLHGKAINIHSVGVDHAPNNSTQTPYVYCLTDQFTVCPMNVNLNTGWMTIYGSGGYPSKWVSGWTHIAGTALDNGESSGVLVRFTKNNIARGGWYESTYRVWLTDGTSSNYVDLYMTFFYEWENGL